MRCFKLDIVLPILALILGTSSGRGDTVRPNIVVVTVDDLGISDLACYGSDLHETPHLDKIASAGARFTSAYAAAPVCSPTRAALMTGKHPARLGMTIWHEAAAKGPNQSEPLLPPRAVANLPHDELCLAELLKELGYQTLHVGKWHLGNAAHYPETHGFDTNIGGSLWGAPPTYFWPYRGVIYNELRYVPGLVGGQSQEYLTDRLTDEAMELIEANQARPFFLNLCFHNVHTPIEGKPALVTRYRQRISTKQPTKHRNAEYAAMVDSVDYNIGRLASVLDRLGLRERTLLIITSDNGGVTHQSAFGRVTSNAPWRSGKGSLYEGGIRVPLIIQWPKMAIAGRTCATPVITQDLFSTIAEAAHAEASSQSSPVDGQSLMPLLRDHEGQLQRTALYWHFPHYYPTTTPVSAVRRGRHKLLRYYEDDRVELYDLDSDPAEALNLAAHQPEMVDELRTQLDGWLQAVGARLPSRKH